VGGRGISGIAQATRDHSLIAQGQKKYFLLSDAGLARNRKILFLARPRFPPDQEYRS
jgi:hypothetical protein